jgi:hypothetical protein
MPGIKLNVTDATIPFVIIFEFDPVAVHVYDPLLTVHAIVFPAELAEGPALRLTATTSVE